MRRRGRSWLPTRPVAHPCSPSPVSSPLARSCLQRSSGLGGGASGGLRGPLGERSRCPGLLRRPALQCSKCPAPTPSAGQPLFASRYAEEPTRRLSQNRRVEPRCQKANSIRMELAGVAAARTWFGRKRGRRSGKANGWLSSKTSPQPSARPAASSSTTDLLATPCRA